MIKDANKAAANSLAVRIRKLRQNIVANLDKDLNAIDVDAGIAMDKELKSLKKRYINYRNKQSNTEINEAV